MYRSTGVSYAPRAYVGATGAAHVPGLRGLLTNPDGSTAWWKVGLAAVAVVAFVGWVIPKDRE